MLHHHPYGPRTHFRRKSVPCIAHNDSYYYTLEVSGKHGAVHKGVSATAKTRLGFEQALDALTSGDSLVLWKMDRAFRSLRHSLDILERFERDNIHFMVITEGIDTTTPMGRCFYQIQNAFGELERNLISERTKAGLQAARERGVRLGRPKTLNPKQRITVRSLIASGVHKDIIAKRYGVSSRTIYRLA